MPLSIRTRLTLWYTAILLTILAVILGVITIPIHALLLRQGTAHASASAEDGAPTPSLTLGEAARTAVFWVRAFTRAFIITMAKSFESTSAVESRN